MTGSLAFRLKSAPKAGACSGRKDRVAELAKDPRAEPMAALLQGKAVAALLAGIADHSPYLWHLARSDPARLSRILENPPEASLKIVLEELTLVEDTGASAIMRHLRKAKQETALLIGLADLGGVWGVEEVTGALSQAADTFVSHALRFLLREAHDAGKLALPDPANPEKGCGMVVLALGKHGARELNYSSDVDLIVLFDPDAASLAGNDAPAATFVRIVKGLVKLLEERTGDGYVLRVDLRLRPDPGSTAIAISLAAAYGYYETLGQNWERAALIKARPVAGDLALGHRFLAELAPFVWRKYFDYAAIADIHAMKRQIHAARGHAEVTVAGHDIKLGRGGIREIEFFVQTQQLIFGGRRPHLRGPRTLDMLAALQQDGWVTPGAVKDLHAAYVFLRGIEHRLQMLADEQTQRLPSDPDALARFARFCGYANLDRFAKAMTAQLRKVETHYARLFEHAPGLDSAAGSLVFTGVADDPETLATLRKLGFRQPAEAAETIRGWHFGRRAAVQSPRAREVLTELVPGLLDSFSTCGDPDAALANFDAALAKMPAAVELFSLLKSSQKLRELFGDILGGAPRLARAVVQRPHVLDAAIDPAMADAAALETRVKAGLALASGAEDFLDRARSLAQEEMFAIGVRLFAGQIDPPGAAAAYTTLAEGILRETLARAEAAMVAEYGAVPGGRCIILAMGKLGSREMTATSDLDLILIYDFDEARSESGGPRRLHAVPWYARLTQRIVSALTVATRQGGLYDVDLRLRPSGGKGPLATQARGFLAYQTGDAETWEHMALTRARVVAGDARLGGAIERAIRAILARPPDKAKLVHDIASMRALVANEKGEADPADLKLVAGGILDIEFIQQYFVLLHAAAHPALAVPGRRGALAALVAAGLLTPDDGATLTAAQALYTAVTQIQRLTLDAASNPALAGEGVKRRIAAAAGLPDYAHLTRELAETRARVRAIFQTLLPLDPAKANLRGTT